MKKTHNNVTPIREEHTDEIDDQNSATEFYDDNGTEERYTIKLSVQNNPSENWTLTIADNALIGRAENCKVKLNDKSVSREQCKIAAESIGLVVINLSTSNVTKLNGIRVNGKAALHSGDIIKFGRVSLKVDFIQRIGADVHSYSNASSDSDSGNTESIF